MFQKSDKYYNYVIQKIVVEKVFKNQHVFNGWTEFLVTIIQLLCFLNHPPTVKKIHAMFKIVIDIE